MPVMQSPPGPYTIIDGKRCLYFVGTGYLGLQSHPEVLRAACEATLQYGLHSATTRAGLGTTPPLLEVEQLAASFFQAEEAFYFPSGYPGTSILLDSLAGQFDAIFVDALSHYCITESASHSSVETHRFEHRSAEHLADTLDHFLPAEGRPLVMTDGVFSAQGTIAPIPEYLDLLAKYEGALLLIDDAHGLGVLGEKGRGTLEHFGISAAINQSWTAPSLDEKQPSVPVSIYRCGTLSKAIGGYGGIIAGERRFIELLKKNSHWFKGVTPPPTPIAAATATALQIVRHHPQLRKQLYANVRQMKEGLRRLGFPCDETPVPIIPLTPGNASEMRRIQERLFARNIAIAYLPSYAGLGSEGGLRIALFATHTHAMIEQFLDQFKTVL